MSMQFWRNDRSDTARKHPLGEDHKSPPGLKRTNIGKPFVNIKLKIKQFHARTCSHHMMSHPFGLSVKIVLRKNFILALILINIPILCYAYYKLNLLNYAWYNRAHRSVLHCDTATEDMDALVTLSRLLHDRLKELNVTHWLAYGSLWGALRYKAPLPWDNDLDFGVLRNDLERLPWDKLEHSLASNGMDIHYSSWGGFYRVTMGNARADLMIFDAFANNGYLERVGVESYVFFVNYKKMHAFPSELVRKPLPTTPFAGIAMPVPHDGVEMQKYHYPYDWWKESKPVGC